MAERALVALSLVMLVTLVSVGPIAAQPAPELAERPARAAVLRERGALLLDRLERGDTIRILAFGDSLADGWNTDGRHAYHGIVADMLQYSFPQSRIELTVRGHPGETTTDALWRFDAEVPGEEPDLLLVQFGGNDMGWARSVAAYRRGLTELLTRAADDTPALAIACLAPIVHENPANRWSETAREVAASVGVPAADLDRAIREGDADFRGPFPHTSHPSEFTHMIMATEILRALSEATGSAPSLQCEFATGPVLATGDAHPVTARIRNLLDADTDCAARTEALGEVTDQTVHLAAHQTGEVTHELALPMRPAGQRSYSFPVRLMVRDQGIGAVDLCWLTVAPAIAADGAQSADLTWYQLAEDSLTLDRHSWLGLDDLAGRFAVVVLPETVRFIVEVADDDISIANLLDPSRGDSVELYLDLRPDADQGKPIYSADVLALQIIAPGPAGEPVAWRNLHDLPADLTQLAVRCVRTQTGYRAEVDIPLAAIVARRGEKWQGLGFDVGINDADFGGTRECQMMWAGTADNYLSPAYLGALYTDPVPAGATRRTLQ